MTVADLFEDAPCGYICATPDRRIVSVNRAVSTWLGYSPTELIGKPFTELFSAGGRIHYETHFSPLLEMHGEISGIAVDLITADGARLPALAAANTQRDADGRAVLLRVVLQDARDRRSYEQELLDARRQAEYERTRAQVLARTLQLSLLPPTLSPPDGLAASAYYHAATDDVGGDFYDLFPLSARSWGFFLGDVCGKGAQAAALTSLTRYTLRTAAAINDDPMAVLRTLNVVLNQEKGTDRMTFCTVIFGVLTRVQDSVDVVLVSGGHPPALLLAADGQVRYVDTAGGQPVGVTADATFVSAGVRLRAGDTLTLYTDGLTEARTGVGRQRYDDEEALIEFASAHAPTTPAAIVSSIRSLLDGLGSGVEDDVAVMALGVPSA